MYFLRGIAYVLILKLLLIQWFSCKLISLKAGEITYEYDNSEKIGEGAFSLVFKGKRIDGEKIDDVAFKVADGDSVKRFELENYFYRKIGEHESIPKFYHYFPETNETKATIVMELLGENLGELHERSKYFSAATVARIGLQTLDALEHIYRKGFTHGDLHTKNIGLALNNNSKIVIFDFNNVEVWGEPNHFHKIDIYYLRSNLRIFLGSNSIDPVTKWLSKGEVTQKQLDDINSNSLGFLEVLEKFDAIKMSFDQCAEAFRNILKAELEKHKDEPNYNTFDWMDQ